jgi:magnesium-transporting ATPase (P-type)
MEFSSDRKMMSILVKDPQDGLVKLYVKGADEVILQRMANT